MPLIRIEGDHRGWPAFVPPLDGQAAEAARAAAALLAAHALGCYAPVCFDFRSHGPVLAQFGSWRPLIARLARADAGDWRRYSAIASQVRTALCDAGLVVAARRSEGSVCPFWIAEGVAIDTTIGVTGARAALSSPDSDDPEAGADGHRWGDPPPLTAKDLVGVSPRERDSVREAHGELRAAHAAYESPHAIDIAKATGRLANVVFHLTGDRVGTVPGGSAADEIAKVVEIIRLHGAARSLGQTQRALLLLAGVECAMLLRHRLRFREEFDAMRSIGGLLVRGTDNSPIEERAVLRWHHVLIETCALAGETSAYASLSRDGLRWREGLVASMREQSPGGLTWLADYAMNLSLMVFDAVDAANDQQRHVRLRVPREWLAQNGARLTPQQQESVAIREVLGDTGERRKMAFTRLEGCEHRFHRTHDLWSALLDAARAQPEGSLGALTTQLDRSPGRAVSAPRRRRR